MELTLQFAGVLQSWGIPEYDMSQRRTASLPTHSAICGLIGNAMGLRREDEKELEEIKNKISIVSADSRDRVRRITDDQIVGMNGNKRETADGSMIDQLYPMVHKEYVQDNDFTVVISGEDSFMQTVKEALLKPKRPLHLGRKCCTGYMPVLKEG